MFAMKSTATPLRLAAGTGRLSRRDNSHYMHNTIAQPSQALAGSAVARGAGEPPGNRTGALSYADSYCSWPFTTNDRH